MEPIDFVVLWVDGNDPEWKEKRSMYTEGEKSDAGENRYRDWDNLVYWFRAVAAYAPWVNRIHLVTDGQVPHWLNITHPKIHLVNHADYIPESALPIFNSSGIEIAIHRIPGLSDRFVYFNDDMFLNKPVSQNLFFHGDLPVDMPGLTRPSFSSGNPDQNSVFSSLLMNDFRIINQHFKKRQILVAHWKKWFRLSYGKTFLRTILNLGRHEFDGMVMPHLAVPYRKNDLLRVWAACGDELELVQYNRFRDRSDINHFLFRFWRLCVGDFYPSASKGKYIPIKDLRTAKRAADTIRKGKATMICLNDCWEGNQFEIARDIINAAFKERLYEKCEFEY